MGALAPSRLRAARHPVVHVRPAHARHGSDQRVDRADPHRGDDEPVRLLAGHRQKPSRRVPSAAARESLLPWPWGAGDGAAYRVGWGVFNIGRLWRHALVHWRSMWFGLAVLALWYLVYVATAVVVSFVPL